MRNKIIAWDLGTSGNKASLYDADGNCIAETFYPYKTYYSADGKHEQSPDDWVNAVILSTNTLIEKSQVSKREILCCGISGHSLGCTLIDKNGSLLQEKVPIWSDCRASEEANEFFREFDYHKWYNLTGNGVNPGEYPVFKIVWFRNHKPDVYEKIYKVLGTKDYVNYRLTGRIATDHSYASGSGAYDLLMHDYSDEVLLGNGLSRDLFPEILQSTDVVGNILPEMADRLGLDSETVIVAGGVDNTCMAIGAKSFKAGRAYISLGTSCWIAVTGEKPVLDTNSFPYVFALRENLYNSALCIASGGSAYKWAIDNLYGGFAEQAKESSSNVYEALGKLIMSSKPGAGDLIFNPCLSGGMPFDDSPNIRGGFLGLQLRHTRADIMRSVLEGITYNLRQCKERLENLVPIDREILIVGGGSKTAVWRQIIADCFNKVIIKSNIDDQAAALGAAAFAANGAGLWSSYDLIDSLHKTECYVVPNPQNTKIYNHLFEIYEEAGHYLSRIGDKLKTMRE